MPKKRFSSQYSKPQSTVHPSLNSSATQERSSSGSVGKDASPSVNELISSLRSSQISPSQRPAATVTTPTLPPQIRELLSWPETPTPTPRARNRRHFDRNGRRVPGPPPPRSWLDGSRHAPPEVKKRKNERAYPHDLNHLPGLAHKLHAEDDEHQRGARRLQDMCLRRIACDWEFMRQYERNNLADLPATLRMQLLSNIAVYGPEDGVGFDGLKHILMTQREDGDNSADLSQSENNEDFFRMDISGSLGWSISFRQLIEFVEKPTQQTELAAESWEETITNSLRCPIPHLTHLSLSHPVPTVSWPRFLTFAKHVPTLTHLSLAYWPVPSAAPNSTTTVMSPGRGQDVQYGATNYYSHSIDSNFREAASILRRLASSKSTPLIRALFGDQKLKSSQVYIVLSIST